MKINRQRVYERCNGHCGYCGKDIAIKDMQVDHMTPKWRLRDPIYFKATVDQIESYDNYMPTCRRCNHYKREKDVEGFRVFMKTLHGRLEKDYKVKVAVDYRVVQIVPFDGIFYFEKYELEH